MNSSIVFALCLTTLLIAAEASPAGRQLLQWRGTGGATVNRGGWGAHGSASNGNTNVHGSVNKPNGGRPTIEVGGSHTGRNGVEVRGSAGVGPGGKNVGVEVRVPIPG